MLQRVDDFFAMLERVVISYSIILMTLILIGNVASRSIFNESWTFAEETGEFFVVVITFIGISYAARKGRHLSMTAILELLSFRAKKTVMIIISAFTSLLLFYLAYLSASYMVTVEDLQRVTPALRIPLYILIGVMPIGFLAGGIQYLRTFLRNVKRKGIHEGTEKVMEKEGETS